jgi:molecular chaperone DnaK (HSP70)
VSDRTISIGIDLGTTNSAVAINQQGNIEIVKKPGGLEYTPSVFGFDKSKNKIVGQRAYESLFSESAGDGAKNFKPEIKRVIGTPEKFYFARADVAMNAEEISAEILKSLTQDILRKYPHFDITAAVITIPAAFSVLQCEATKRAGELSGYKHVVLLQEPIAAAVAYGFGNNKNEHWLVYDLGGGTFDVALVSSRDGILSVLGHNGDNFLGGKNLDWEIVDKLITPRLRDQFSLAEFRRDSEAHRGKFVRLKYLAERAKIELSQYDNTTIEVDGIGGDDVGSPIALSLKVSRSEMERLIRPLIDRTIDLCKETLKEAGLNPAAVSKIILVGGPTQMPYVRERLEADLGIQIDASVDPLTVVARGACIFAQSQLIPEDLAIPHAKKHGALNIKFHHETLTASAQQTVSGIVEELTASTDPYFVQIQSDGGSFVSEKIRVREGRFIATVILEPNKSNKFWVFLFDQLGNDIPLNTESFSITHGLSVPGAPIPHSIGVVVAARGVGNYSEKFEILIEKGEVLPVSKTERFKTVRELKRSEKDNPLWIRVGEGESNIPDRNTFVCQLGIEGNSLPRDLPQGTDLDLTVSINEMRELSVTAYILNIDLTLNARSTFVDEIVDVGNVEQELDAQRDRATAVSKNCSSDQVTKIESTIRTVSTSLQNARLDEDEKRKAVKQVKDLKLLLDEVEQDSQLSKLRSNFDEHVQHVGKFIANVPDASDRERFAKQFEEIKLEGEKAFQQADKSLLMGVNDRLRELGSRALYSDPGMWRFEFETLTNSGHAFTNAREGEYFTQRGKEAINSGDMEELKRCCRGLANLLPLVEKQTKPINRSGITR